ncbi:hypothetical protein [Methylobacterium sp. WL120]|uniref:hypothetical protein n=1 Tax=Methylobacterium sp. WL120 TaxID=2603887 RepID=UPI0011CC31F3|nr:hypothetical protein [Methylobacterium sp. WL120]TXM69612.1 hypothetical protein FV229_04520 [Methylobacterium sp. WL120]
MDKIEITASLRNAKWNVGTEDRRFLTGDVIGDKLERWPDGEHIHTTYVLEEPEKNVFKTRSGHYYKVINFDEG